MRVMACIAQDSLRVFFRNYLRESFRFRGIRFVATNAQGRDIRQLWLVHFRIIGMLRERAMACFARDLGVFPLCARLSNGIVASFAKGLARE